MIQNNYIAIEHSYQANMDVLFSNLYYYITT